MFEFGFVTFTLFKNDSLLFQFHQIDDRIGDSFWWHKGENAEELLAEQSGQGIGWRLTVSAIAVGVVVVTVREGRSLS